MVVDLRRLQHHFPFPSDLHHEFLIVHLNTDWGSRYYFSPALPHIDMGFNTPEKEDNAKDLAIISKQIQQHWSNDQKMLSKHKLNKQIKSQKSCVHKNEKSSFRMPMEGKLAPQHQY
ncbi:hypothetical protein T10_5715 [Trichinella papuae]|uniref:Uncharacterized protein n=1 Tax=Trichinella papuae TaxID=268474 RepID=A0A0V1M2Q2_9BILA|nr:hypothetical protein T10_12103 [Trichinella papuae]KRZ66053.1 hypothetical protein T10_301 [Trichinella papuae]KRZ66201.1 hypothetical protein T10_5715 [Trichinella papuae]